jgi:hypothetical protein
MKHTWTICLSAAFGMILSSLADAGNAPNSTRTLTTGIGSGTTTSRIPGSLPYSTRATRRNSHAERSISNFSNRYSHRRDSGYRSAAAPAVSGKPTTFPGSGAIGKHAGSTPAVGNTAFPAGFPPARNAAPAGISSGSVSTGIPAAVSLPAAVPGSVTLPSGTVSTGRPATIPPVNTGGGAGSLPAMPALPPQATQHMPDAATSALGRRGNGGRP